MMLLNLLTVLSSLSQSFDLCKESVIKDGQGYAWLNYCDDLGRTVMFFKDYTKGWTFHTDYEAGVKEFAYRIPYLPITCNDGEPEIDDYGYAWETWCLSTGEKIEFQKTDNMFIIDKTGGDSIFSYRRALFSIKTHYSTFLQLETEDKDCMELEGDTSGRYFPVEYSFDNVKIVYQKDNRGNFILDPVSKTRITAFAGAKKQMNFGVPLCMSQNVFEIDPSQNFYWVIEFSYDFPVVFAESVDTYYFIDPETGKRKSL